MTGRSDILGPRADDPRTRKREAFAPYRHIREQGHNDGNCRVHQHVINGIIGRPIRIQTTIAPSAEEIDPGLGAEVISWVDVDDEILECLDTCRPYAPCCAMMVWYSARLPRPLLFTTCPVAALPARLPRSRFGARSGRATRKGALTTGEVD